MTSTVKLPLTLFISTIITIIILKMRVVSTNPPNVVVIMADDMGFDDVSFHGSKQFLTPNIDALAYHGMILNNLYAPPMCTPSRAAFMTGNFPIHTGTQHFVISNEEPWGLDPNLTTIAEIFKKSGYSTNLIGKWHLGFAYKNLLPLNRGFDTHYGYLGAYIDYYHRRSLMPLPNVSLGFDFRRNMKLECRDEGVYVTDLLTKEAEKLIESHDVEKPLLLVVNHLAPHTANEDEPLQAPQEVVDKFSHIKDENRRIYAAMVTKLDESVGKIIYSLEKKQILNNTIVIFYSDNGSPSVGLFHNSGRNWPFRGQKNTPWEGGSRVAGAIWSPLLRQRQKIFQQKMNVADWLPTLARAANIKLNPDLKLDGLDFWQELSEGSVDPFNREMVHVLDDIWHVTSFLKGSYKYINGTTINGLGDGVLTGRNHEEDPRNSFYAGYVLDSPTGKILKNYDITPLSKRKVNRLRNLAEIKCEKPKGNKNCKPLIEECLFNIDNDPCEQYNLAHLPEFADILEDMKLSVKKYRASAVAPENRAGAPENDPSRHDCTWKWFMEDPPTKDALSCGYTGTPCSV